jgi:AAA family ATP:ADP antiporter
MSDTPQPNALARLFRSVAKVEPHETRAVVMAFLFFMFLLGSYYVLRPVRDALGTVYGAKNLQELYTGTTIGTLIAAPVYAAFASRIRLATFLPWVYGFFIVSILVFYGLFTTVQQDRYIAAAFFIWVSVFNLFITSVFWSFMADLFSRSQAKRLFGFIAAGGSVGAAIGPGLTALLAERLGNNTLLLCSCAGFGIAIWFLRQLEKEKSRVAEGEPDGQTTRLDTKLGGNLFDGFRLLAKSPYLLLIGAFVLLLTWVSTILYFQQADLISQAFDSREARTRTFATVDFIVNSCAILIQMFGTGRIAQRFGIITTLVINPVIMVLAFAAVAISPVLTVLLTVQVVRRVSEYAIARPGREMLFTVVDQESKYKAKNVIDTVIYRTGDLSSAWITSFMQGLGWGVGAIAVFGVLVSAIWGGVAIALGRRYENVHGAGARPAPAQAA